MHEDVPAADLAKEQQIGGMINSHAQPATSQCQSDVRSTVIASISVQEFDYGKITLIYRKDNSSSVLAPLISSPLFISLTDCVQ
jgi:hypothetical protein